MDISLPADQFWPPEVWVLEYKMQMPGSRNRSKMVCRLQTCDHVSGDCLLRLSSFRFYHCIQRYPGMAGMTDKVKSY
ncbi:MAG: hypothetical protein H6549_00705 [Chitinophagales bacterium]|nr:hypothetical protein [Chitinophagales bacterium]